MAQQSQEVVLINPISNSNSKTTRKTSQNTPLCSPNRNFTFLDSQKLQGLYEKLEKCGKENAEFYNTKTKIFFRPPIYCDNRICSNPECQKHRQYKYMTAHFQQIEKLNKSMKNPKAWVFTGWKLPIEEFTREFLQLQLKKLFYICSKYSRSEFSIHMELKVYPQYKKDGSLNLNYGMAYLHFHVVTAGFPDLHKIHAIWGRVVKYEQAIKPNDLAWYVSKYAGKSPILDTKFLLANYLNLVYKLQMHRFSTRPGDHIKRSSDWVDMSSILYEVKSELRKNSYKNISQYSARYYYKILEPPSPDEPPAKFKQKLITDYLEIDTSPDPNFPFYISKQTKQFYEDLPDTTEGQRTSKIYKSWRKRDRELEQRLKAECQKQSERWKTKDDTNLL